MGNSGKDKKNVYQNGKKTVLMVAKRKSCFTG